MFVFYIYNVVYVSNWVCLNVCHHRLNVMKLSGKVQMHQMQNA